MKNIFVRKPIEIGCEAENSKEYMVKNYFRVMDEMVKDEVTAWCAKQKVKTESEDFLIQLLKKENENFVEPYIIQVLEVSCNESGLYYKKGDKVARGYELGAWERMAKEFYPELNSRLAKLGQIFIFYAYRGVNKYWTITELCDDSHGIGNYWDSPKAAHGFETSGKRIAAGYSDGIGNTSKVCKYDDYLYAVCGGHAGKTGESWPIVGHIDFSKDLKKVYSYASAVLVCNCENLI